MDAAYIALLGRLWLHKIQQYCHISLMHEYALWGAKGHTCRYNDSFLKDETNYHMPAFTKRKLTKRREGNCWSWSLFTWVQISLYRLHQTNDPTGLHHCFKVPKRGKAKNCIILSCLEYMKPAHYLKKLMAQAQALRLDAVCSNQKLGRCA